MPDSKLIAPYEIEHEHLRRILRNRCLCLFSCYLLLRNRFRRKSAFSADHHDSGIDASLVESLIINIALLALFAVQHSVMAQRGFKRWWEQIVPDYFNASFAVAEILSRFT